MFLDEDRWADFLKHGATYSFQPRIADPLEFAAQRRVFLLRHSTTQMDFDLIIAGVPFEAQALLRAGKVKVGRTSYPVPSPEDFVIMKALANRPKDKDDIEGVLDCWPDLDHDYIRRQVDEFAQVLESPEISDDLEHALSRRTKKSGKKKRKLLESRGVPPMRAIAPLLGVLLMTASANAQVTGPTPFGKTADGTPVESYTLTNKNGVTVKVMTLGATITEINVPDKAGKIANVVLGFDSARGPTRSGQETSSSRPRRAASPIASPKGRSSSTAKSTSLRQSSSNGPNHLHGGVKKSLDKVLWKCDVLNFIGDDTLKGLAFAYTSPDGEEGFPGTLKITVSYWLTDKNELHIYFLEAENRQGDAGQSHQSQLFQPRRRRRGDGARSRNDARRRRICPRR